MSTAASAVTTVESATTRQNERVEFNGWDDSGTPIRVEPPKKQDSAPVKKEDSAASSDSATDKKTDKSADSVSDSATDKDAQKPHQKTKEDTERRIQELLEDKKSLQRRLESLERGKTSDEKRDTQQVSQPVKEEPKVPGLKPFLEQFFAKAENKGKAYEDGVEAWQDARQVERDKQTEQRIRQQVQQESAAKEFSGKMKDAETRYGKEEAAKIIPAAEKIVADVQIPAVIKAMMDRSDVLIDLTYALSSDPAEFDSFLKLCKSDPGAALEKMVTVQALVREKLKGKSAATKIDDKAGADKSVKTTPERGEDGKFKSSEEKDGKEKDGASDQDKPRVPKPHSEVGGRGTASVSEEAAAAASNDFKAMDAAMTRRFAAQLRK